MPIQEVACQRALLIIKPDGLGHVRRTVNFLTNALSQRGVNFRIVGPCLLSINPSFASKIWQQEGQRYDNHRRYMSCGYSNDPRIISAPSITMILEAEKRKDQDLIGILRDDRVIGPTNVERKLEEADEKTAQGIMQSLRYKLTLGAGSRIWPFPRKENDPMYNRIHCSDSDESAEREISTVYDQYQDGITTLPLLDLKRESDIAKIIYSEFGNLGYRNFGEKECDQLAYEIKGILPFLRTLNRHYEDNIGKEIQHLNPGLMEEKTTPDACVIGICGDTGSGKSSVVKSLVDAGFREIIQHTSRPMRPGEKEGKDYCFISNEQMLDAIARGNLAGVDRIGDYFYGVSTSWLHPSSLMNFRGVVAAGPNTLAGLRESLPQGTRFGTIFLDCSPQTLIERISQRHRDEGDELQRRIERVKGTKERYGPRLAEFDLILNNDSSVKFLDLIGSVLKFAKGACKYDVTRQIIELNMYTMTPMRRIVQNLFDSDVLKCAASMRDRVQPAPYEELKAQIDAQMRKPLEIFFEELQKANLDRPYLKKEEKELISKNLVAHTLNAYLVSKQIFMPWEITAQVNKRLGRLGECKDDKRIKKNLDAIISAAETIPEDERETMIFAHDIGKIVQFNDHPAQSADLIDKFNLFEFIPKLSVKQKRMIKLLIKYHQNIADHAYQFMSWNTAVVRMFNDREARILMRADDGSVNIPAVTEYLNRNRFFTICDVAGSLSEKGGLRNINVEYYLRIFDKIQSIFEANVHSYDDAIRKLAAADKDAVKDQLSSMFIISDLLADERKEGLDHYWQLILQSKERAVKEKLISESDWEETLDALNYIDNKYCPHLWWMMFGSKAATITPETVYNTDPEAPPTSIINNFVMIGKMIRSVVPGFGVRRNVILAYCDRNGREIAGRKAEFLTAKEQHNVFCRARGYVVKGDRIFFFDSEGQEINDLTAIVISGEKSYTIKFEHHNMDLGKDAIVN